MGVSSFPVENFLSHSAEKFRRGILQCCINFWRRGGGGGYQKFTSKCFCLTVPKISVGECFIVAIISGTEKVWRRGGVSKNSVKNFLSHSAESFRRGILQCCINFWRRGGGGYQKFTSKNFCLTVPTKFSVVESFIVALISGIEKSLEKRGGGYQDFPSKNFCLTVPKISVGESFTVALVFLEGGYQIFSSKIFCLTVPKNSLGESFIVALLSGIEKVWRRGGEVSRFSVNNFLSHSPDEKFRRRIFYCCINFGYRKSLEQRGGGWEYQVFPLKIFCLTVPKSSVGESFSVALIFGEEGGGVSKVYVEMFLSHSAENFRRRMLYCCNNFGNRKSLEKGGSIKKFRQNFFVSQCRKFP